MLIEWPLLGHCLVIICNLMPNNTALNQLNASAITRALLNYAPSNTVGTAQ